MPLMNDACRAFASLALFRQLYEEKKNDVYGIVAEFLKSLILNKGLREFSLSQITMDLNKEFDFKLPEIIIKPALKRLEFISISNHIYKATINGTLTQLNLYKNRNDLCVENNLILDELFAYVRNHIGKELTIQDKEKVTATLCSYLMDDTENIEFLEYVSAFIVEKSVDVEYRKKLNEIREGIILNTGIRYTPQINEIKAWDHDLTIFLDTEILFHIGGFNGELFKKVIQDLLDLIQEVNLLYMKTEKTKKITLTYFPIMKKEIKEYFAAAEKIVEGENSFPTLATAMKNIIQGCKTAADVIQKRETFINLLEHEGIKEYPDKDYYSNPELNIESQELVEHFMRKLSNHHVDVNDISESLRLLNFVNVIRRGVIYSHLEDSRAILLTGKSLTVQMAMDDIIRKGGFNLATNYNYLISRLWFKLNKGFGEASTPKSFDVLTRAQIVLSKQLNSSISYEYNRIREQYKNGELSKEVAITTIIALRNQCRYPEQILSEDIGDVLESITEQDIVEYQDELHYHKEEEEKSKKECDELKKQMELKEKEHKEEIEKTENRFKQEIDSQQAQISNLNEKMDETNDNVEKLVSFYEGEQARLNDLLKEERLAKERLKLRVLIGIVIIGIIVGLVVFILSQALWSFVSPIIGLIPLVYNWIKKSRNQ